MQILVHRLIKLAKHISILSEIFRNFLIYFSDILKKKFNHVLRSRKLPL
jgi:hypothetical protein